MRTLDQAIQASPLFRELIDNLRRPNDKANPGISKPNGSWTPRSLLGDRGLTEWKNAKTKKRNDPEARWVEFWTQVEPLTSVAWFVEQIDDCIKPIDDCIKTPQRDLPTNHPLYAKLLTLGRGSSWQTKNRGIAPNPTDVNGLLGRKGLACWNGANKPGQTAQARWDAFVNCAGNKKLFEGTLSAPACPGITNQNPGIPPLQELFLALDAWIS